MSVKLSVKPQKRARGLNLWSDCTVCRKNEGAALACTVLHKLIKSKISIFKINIVFCKCILCARVIIEYLPLISDYKFCLLTQIGGPPRLSG